METSRPAPAGVARADHLRDLADLFGADTATHEGLRPYCTVLLGLDVDVPQAAQRDEARWRAQRADASRQGVAEAVLAELDRIVLDAHLRGRGLAVVADAGRVRVMEHLEHPPASDRVVVGALPALAPIIAARQERVPHLVVSIDRRGADIVAVGVTRGGVVVEHDAVDAASGPQRKVGPGGWSQRRYQQRVENTWEHTAAAVAEEVVRIVDDVEARVVVVAGDVRARTMLREAAPGAGR